MIDTIVLTLRQSMFVILKHDNFSPSTIGLYNPSEYYRLGGRSNMVCKQNPLSSDLKKGIYKPRLSVTKRMVDNKFEIIMKIEFSAPKLLFGNNFDELIDSDFSTLVLKLMAVLERMGVKAWESNLIIAPVSAIHFSKNIPLTDYSTPNTYIKQLEKANFNSILDVTKTDYLNGGVGIKAHANSFEIAFYDKLRDLEQAKISPKRSYERDSQIQLGLFEALRKIKPFEVLRMEIRLGKRQKLKQVLSNIGLAIEPTFQNLFSQEIAQKILLYYLQIIEDCYPPLLNYEYNNPRQFFTDFLMNNPDKRYTSALKYLGMRVLLEKMGIREFRQLMGRYSDNAWYALNKDMKNLTQVNKIDTFQLLRDTITNNQPLKLVDFQI